MDGEGRLEAGERDRLLFETHATVVIVQKRQDEIVDILTVMNGRFRKMEMTVAWMRGVGSAVAFLMAGGLGWLGWKK